MTDVLERLHASEINFVIESFWDCGYVVRLGDSINGFVESTRCSSIEDAERWLTDAACRHYPDRAFARTLRTWCERPGSR